MVYGTIGNAICDNHVHNKSNDCANKQAATEKRQVYKVILQIKWIIGKIRMEKDNNKNT